MTARSRDIVPDLVIGGAPRCGTTFLCGALAKHPDTFINRPIVPEPKVCLLPEFDDDAARLARYAEIFGEAPPGVLRIEKTTNYFENDAALRRLARILPDVRYLFILREPVSRAYSNWLWSTKNGLETLPFQSAIEASGQRLSPLPPDKAYARPFDYLERGRYGFLAARWLEAIGADRIAFVLLETAMTDPARFIHDVQGFAGLTPLPWSSLVTGKINATSPLPADFEPDLIAALRDRFRPEIDAFERLTGVDVSAWRV